MGLVLHLLSGTPLLTMSGIIDFLPVHGSGFLSHGPPWYNTPEWVCCFNELRPCQKTQLPKVAHWQALWKWGSTFNRVHVSSCTRQGGLACEYESLNSFAGSGASVRSGQPQQGLPYPQVFPANSDAETPVLNLLPEPQVARFIRLLPQTWFQGGAPCLRAEILACPVSGGHLGKGCMSGPDFRNILYYELTFYLELTFHQILMTCSLRPIH